MSATIDVDFFINYFRKENIEPNVITIKGRTGTVTSYYLEDIYKTIPGCQKYIDGT